MRYRDSSCLISCQTNPAQYLNVPAVWFILLSAFDISNSIFQFIFQFIFQANAHHCDPLCYDVIIYYFRSYFILTIQCSKCMEMQYNLLLNDWQMILFCWLFLTSNFFLVHFMYKVIHPPISSFQEKFNRCILCIVNISGIILYCPGNPIYFPYYNIHIIHIPATC